MRGRSPAGSCFFSRAAGGKRAVPLGFHEHAAREERPRGGARRPRHWRRSSSPCARCSPALASRASADPPRGGAARIRALWRTRTQWHRGETACFVRRQLPPASLAPTPAPRPHTPQHTSNASMHATERNARIQMHARTRLHEQRPVQHQFRVSLCAKLPLPVRPTTTPELPELFAQFSGYHPGTCLPISFHNSGSSHFLVLLIEVCIVK